MSFPAIQLVPAIKLRRPEFSERNKFTFFYFDKNAVKDAEKVLKRMELVHGDKVELVMVEESQARNVFSRDWSKE
jgi:hypothetical protein